MQDYTPHVLKYLQDRLAANRAAKAPWKVRAYAAAMASVKAHGRPLTVPEDAREIQGLGQGILAHVVEFWRTHRRSLRPHQLVPTARRKRSRC